MSVVALKSSDFYPRSPCGERPGIPAHRKAFPDFYPRSPCGERPPSFGRFQVINYFYPRSPCGERPWLSAWIAKRALISIHALLAESDAMDISARRGARISIHALLAESDSTTIITICTVSRFLSTLSLRRATRAASITPTASRNFYPRSPCGERLERCSLEKFKK